MSDNFEGTQSHRFMGVDNKKFPNRPAENTLLSLNEAKDKNKSPYLGFTPRNVRKVLNEVKVDAFHPEAYSLSVASCLIAKNHGIPINAWFVNERKPENQTGILRRHARWKNKYGFNVNYITDFVSDMEKTNNQINMAMLKNKGNSR